MRILRLIYQLSHRFDSKEERFKIFKNAIEKASNSLHTIVHEVSVQGQQHGKYDSSKQAEPEEKLTLNVAWLNELEQHACEKIANWAKDGHLAKYKDLPVIYIIGKNRVKRRM